jgi:predicted permease
MQGIVKDLRFTFRLMARDRWFSAAAIVALALGIGVNTVGFTVVNGAFLRGLPYEESDRLFVLTWQTRAGRRATVSYPELRDWRDQNRSFEDLAAWRAGEMNVSDDRAMPDEARGAWMTANAFGQLNVRPMLGRDFVEADERRGADPVAIIGERMWRRRFAADPNVLGATLRVNGQPSTIVGVMPEQVRFPENTDIWTPLVPGDAEEQRTARGLHVFGRLRPDVSLRAAQAEMRAVAQRMGGSHPDDNRDLVGARVETFTDRFIGGPGRTMFGVVMGAASFVLLIVCANVANLLLSRSGARAREVALRIALGASRWRVIRQLLAESAVLSAVGGGLGLLMARAGARLLDEAIVDVDRPFWIAFTTDTTVVAYVAGICVLTAVAFGLTPALHVTRANSHDLLKEGGRGSAGSRRAQWFSGVMVAVELALTVVLLAGAGLMLRSFVNAHSVDLGFDAEPLLAMRLRLPESKYEGADDRQAFFDRLELRLAAIAGIESAAVTTGVPPLDGGERLVEVEDAVDRAGSAPRWVSIVTTSPRYFDVLGVHIMRGRAFDDRDGAPGAESVIVNERLASRFFGTGDPLGRRLRFTVRDPAPGQPPQVWRTIVGVSPSIPQGSPDDAYRNDVVYLPYRQEGPASASLLIRSRLPASSVLDAVRQEVQAIDRDQPVFTARSLPQMLQETQWPTRVFGALFAVFAAIAVVLSSVGLYAVMAYAVSQRTQEIGVRMAIGAASRDVGWLVLRRGLAQLGVGLTIGLAGALALSRVLQRALVGVSPADPLTFAAITALVVLVSLAACLLPARRAARIDPLVALRHD